MRNLSLGLFCALFIALIFSCGPSHKEADAVPNKNLAALFNRFHDGELARFPVNATYEGDSRFNDRLPIDFTHAFRDSLKIFYTAYGDSVSRYADSARSPSDKLSVELFKYNIDSYLKGLAFTDNLIPFNQFYALPLTLGQLGSGDGAQPFKTVKDYDDWLARATAFAPWADSAIAYFGKGAEKGFVLPKSLVVKMVGQMEDLVAKDISKSVFMGPIGKMPADFPAAEKTRLKQRYEQLVSTVLNPVYSKLAKYLKNDYLPKARATSGLSALPGGTDYYKYLVAVNTTTDMAPEKIYDLGLEEVKRIRAQMDSVKKTMGFTGSLQAFFTYLKEDKKLMPYKQPKEILDAFENIHQKMKPALAKLFDKVPKTPFEIRQTEAYRAATASAEYNQGSADGSRPGIFYVPIIDATKFNITSGMENLFLHEAIPGHHYQISLQQEDTLLPKFRRFGGQNAYVEGWALYCESLGKELGLYTDPYQYIGALGDEMHRAVRLVVDVAIHTKGMTREEAIAYMMDNEAISEQGATAEIERYMAIPG